MFVKIMGKSHFNSRKCTCLIKNGNPIYKLLHYRKKPNFSGTVYIISGKNAFKRKLVFRCKLGILRCVHMFMVLECPLIGCNK